MNTTPYRLITQVDLREQGLSTYMVRQITEDLDFSRRKTGLRLYKTPDVVAAIEGKLAEAKIRRTSREKLENTLAWLKGESNIIEVDFLRNLSLEQRAEALEARINVADKSMKSDTLREYENIQKRVQAALAGSKFSS